MVIMAKCGEGCGRGGSVVAAKSGSAGALSKYMPPGVSAAGKSYAALVPLAAGLYASDTNVPGYTNNALARYKLPEENRRQDPGFLKSMLDDSPVAGDRIPVKHGAFTYDDEMRGKER